MRKEQLSDGVAVYLGDCLDILPTLEAGSVDAVVTDPPYSMKHVDGGGFAAASQFYAGGSLNGLDDFDLDKDFEEFELPKSKSKSPAKKKSGKDDDFGVDDEFKDLGFFGSSGGGFDDDDDDF